MHIDTRVRGLDSETKLKPGTPNQQRLANQSTNTDEPKKSSEPESSGSESREFDLGQKSVYQSHDPSGCACSHPSTVERWSARRGEIVDFLSGPFLGEEFRTYLVIHLYRFIVEDILGCEEVRVPYPDRLLAIILRNLAGKLDRSLGQALVQLLIGMAHPRVDQLFPAF
ncbi:hypothetical protein PHSY_005799 [Pseudozyma hubeiensis SY62]|uniref:Uncharacterized protein n=1 Tax=Pseudozyma hubeiensis (strain SY62) TaxID=1305764 RepID=R9PJB5_PSEHS|nr:hypothetical protein PHSY_005799 [Pseudozyma hubeiensis SY62]GAC98210.1 hypothetical protein PHSY_005799 [Pseudozyma hubeiensis SY62]